MEDGVVGWCLRSSPSSTGGSKCGRWNPTAEQVKVLTDLFRSGLRTPTTDQIQKISCQLSSLGKIESKNVFYWFQNHKARERHHTNKKRRRQGPPPHHNENINILSYDNNTIFGSESEVAAATSFSSVTARRLDKDRETETLELFPLSSSSSRIGRKDHHNYNHKESAFSLCSAGNDHLLLDLRLGS